MLLLLGCICIFFTIQLVYYIVLYSKIYRRNNALAKGKLTFTDELPPISVIICAKDELASLREFLPSILNQDYPKFEVVVINDDPTDGSDDYLKLLEEQYDNLYHSFTPNSSRYISHKKLAITLGIKASKYEWLVFTGANCKPASKDWLRLMARNFTPGTDIVLGAYGYEKGTNRFHTKVSFDTLFTSIRTLGFALAGKPYTACGRNLAYRKELFYKNKGFATQLNLQRGDDDLFINQTATAKNTRIETDANAVMWLKPLTLKKTWVEDKLNYIVTSGYYKGNQRYLLGLESTSRLLFYATCIYSIAYGIILQNFILVGIAFLLWLIRYIVQGIVINKTSKSMGYEEVFRFSLPLFDIIQPIQSFKFRILCLIRGKNEFMRNQY